MSRRVTSFFILGIIAGCCASYALASKFRPDLLFKSSAISDSRNAVSNSSVCYYQPIKKKDITYDVLHSQSIGNKTIRSSGNFLYIDIGSIQDVDVQERVMKEVYDEVKNLTADGSSDGDIWVTSDLHGDIKMLMKGLVLSGIVSWNGELQRGKFKAYGKELEVVYPKVMLNQQFSGVYVNLGDIVDNDAFGMANLFVLHDIFEQVKRAGVSDRVKILLGNHEYHDVRSKNSPYMDTLLRFLDMFDVFYEKNGISFSHSPLSYSLKPRTDADVSELKSAIVEDSDSKVGRIVWGVLSLSKIPDSPRKIPHNEIRPQYVTSCSVHGHIHGHGDGNTVHYAYNKRKDVLSVSVDRFDADETKVPIIYRISMNNKVVYSYTTTGGSVALMKNQLDKNLWYRAISANPVDSNEA